MYDKYGKQPIIKQCLLDFILTCVHLPMSTLLQLVGYAQWRNFKKM